ncbi:MGMT family protein [Thiomicrorhabdus chilensis]|uniref:MGMT family protein n=1 Tax=Thiomicrorhabdus chilensis TaxID=63656 RepID=UPI0006847374|nr:MGMT family protein [Thiomicrorhabdus chilensis]
MTQSTDPSDSQICDFNQCCYALLKRIPKGRVTTYKAIAEVLNSKAYRAVGNAMAHNPNLIKVPCHRVVKSNGEVGQYALGSATKIELLEQEGVKVVNNKVVEFETRLYDFKQ